MKTGLQRKFGAVGTILAMSMASASVYGAEAAEGGVGGTRTEPSKTQESTLSKDDVAALKAQLAAQQAQIDQLRQALEQMGKPAGVVAAPATAGFVIPAAKLGEVASTMPVVPGGALPAPIRNATLSQAGPEPPSPLSLKIGDTYITPVGFMDLTYVERSTNTGNGIGTNFAAIPFSNTTTGRLTDGYLSVQNSRIGARFDALVHGAKILGYWESDFLGNQPANIVVSTNAATFRLRLFWIDVKKGQWEVQGGQSWSLITPSRKGISGLPGDIFYSQVTDTNYQIGIPWGRVPSLRLIWHPTDKIALGVAAENSVQYAGGSSGGASPTFPTALSGLLGTEISNGANNFSTPSVHPDIISKLTFDPVIAGHNLHFEANGMIRTFRIFDTVNSKYFTTTGGGGGFNSNLEVIKGGKLRIVENFFYGRGVGRWFFGQGPDLILNPNGPIGLVPAGGTVDGIEAQITKNLFFYGYYGGAYFGRETALDSNLRTPIGYGYAGSPNSQNRTIQEGTIGFQNTFWRDPKYGQLRFDFQYSYLFRTPWSVAAGQPTEARANMFFVNLRYALPGAAPNLK